ncbi:cytochrome P450 [Bradyrhizobium liaoningense]|uniref:cytochrome P450 n=1 Tax=Bradyrhizobium liaoningense TaxID=43992 RepID=UPI001BA750F8|nr:cytochrome P450 [Bradyrhizobium liaoningense]MBR0859134.1 cytochrome P450 [Bradyrhizobium liaoningense]
MELSDGHLVPAAPDGSVVWDIDPYDAGILGNPEPYYAELRSRGPLVYIPRYGILACGRYKETREIFGDWKRFVSSRGVGLTDFKYNAHWREPSIVLEVDPPYHTKTRTVIARALSPHAVARLGTAFREAADKLIDELIDRGSFDAVTELAEVFPTTVFPSAVGLKEVHRRYLVDFGSLIFNALGPDNDLRRRALAAAPDIVAWIQRQCSRDQLEPEGFGATIYAAADSGELSEKEAGMLVRSLLSAGVDTTVTGIGNAIWCLASHPGQFAKLKADPSLARPAFEEVLRYSSPVHSFCRTANVDTNVSGTDIKEGTKILCVLGAANLDEAHWENARTFDIERRPTGHLAFGTGVHGCVGQNVARAEVESLLAAIAAKVRSIEIEGEPVWRPNNAIHALDRMPIRFTAN